MISQISYLPILRWKAGEQWALTELTSEVKAKILPIIELLPNNLGEKKPRSKGLIQTLGEALDSRPFFLDLRHVDNQSAPFDRLIGAMRDAGLVFLPVLPCPRLNAHQNISADYSVAGLRACIRVQHVANAEAARNDMRRLLDLNGLAPTDCYLVIDLGNSVTRAHWLLGDERLLTGWSGIAVAGGAFPKDLSGLAANQEHSIQRVEWTNWTTLRDQRKGIRPVFSDYTIQHAVYSEPPKFPNTSASIRYTTSGRWLIMRGEGLRNADGPGHAGYIGNAMLLSEHSEFCGSAFSRGDSYIAEIAEHQSNPGNPMTWIRAGINHHMTFVVREIANLNVA